MSMSLVNQVTIGQRRDKTHVCFMRLQSLVSWSSGLLSSRIGNGGVIIHNNLLLYIARAPLINA